MNRMNADATTITTWADGFGNWHARLAFKAPARVGKVDLNVYRGQLRSAILAELAEREQKTGETLTQTKARLHIRLTYTVVKDDAGELTTTIHAAERAE